MQDIHQSLKYVQFITKIGWLVENIDEVNIFIKKLPLIPAVIKIQRTDKLPDIEKIKSLMQKYHARSISVEPSISFQLSDISHQQLNNPFLPTKTIHINLTPNESEIFNKFSPQKRKAIRRAQNLGVEIFESNNIEDFIKLKNKTAGFLGFLTTQTIKPLWQTFSPNNAFVLLAKRCHCEKLQTTKSCKAGSRSARQSSYTCHSESKENVIQRLQPKDPMNNKYDNEILAGVLILIWQNTAYYWMAAASNAGKKSFAPTLLVWEALKESKKRGCTNFDFEGIYDDRYPTLNKDWLGFSKFKSGFGGKEIYFPKPFKIYL